MHIIYNPFAGISGDMNLAAMIDLGMDTLLLRSELSKLSLNDEYDLIIRPAEKHGINGTQVKVDLKNQPHHHHHAHDKDHSHKHSHEHHQHTHDRNYADIVKLIKTSGLNIKIQTIAIEIFWEVAVAEGKVHNKKPEEVHFHEVGATDSIIDIVGAAICYHHLNISEVSTTYPELGGGFVKCQHGLMPVPAPATAEILKDVPCTTGAVPKEMTTPTGAAILKVLTNQFIKHPSLDIREIAYGIGHRDVEIPNILRVYECNSTAKPIIKKAIMLECNIDDMSAEELAIVPQILLDAGVQDAYLTPIVMKKGRAATMLSVLCPTELLTIVENLIFEHTSTIGFRYYEVNKKELPRTMKTLNSEWGEVSYKECILPNGDIRRKFEFDQLQEIAKNQNQSITNIRTPLIKALN